MGTEEKKIMNFVVFVVLALECIFLVSSANAQNGDFYFDKYNEFYKQCRGMPEHKHNAELPSHVVRVIDKYALSNLELLLFREELITEIACFRLYAKKFSNDVEELRVPFYLGYVHTYYSALTMKQKFKYLSEGKDKIDKTKNSPEPNELEDTSEPNEPEDSSERNNPDESTKSVLGLEKDKLLHDLRLIQALISLFSYTIGYPDLVDNVIELRRNLLISKINSRRSSGRIKQMYQNQLEAVTKCGNVLNDFLIDALETQNMAGLSAVDKADGGQGRGETHEQVKELSQTALESTNNVVAEFVPGCYLPKKESGFLTVDEDNKLLSKVYNLKALFHNTEFKDKSRITEITRALVTSEYETGIPAPASEGPSAPASAGPSASSSTPTKGQ